MPDDVAFMPPEGQSEYAFPADQGQDEAAAAGERNQQIQQSFDQQRMQRAFAQNFAKAINQVARQQAQQKSS